MSKNLAIWIIGGSSVGKTTLATEIHSLIANITDSQIKPKVVGWGERNREFMYTRMSKYSANLGEFGKTACSGTDTLSTKDRIRTSFEGAIKKSPIVVIEGIMATGTWIDFLASEETKVFLIHLDISPEENFKRLRRRRAEKLNIRQENVCLAPKTMDNLSLKLRNFRNLYRKMSPRVPYHIQINCEVLNQKRTAEVVKAYMLEYILS